MKAFWIACTLMLATTGLARAELAGLNLSWNDCATAPAAASNRTFACNTNSGSSTLVGSFLTAYNVPDASGIAGTLYLQSSSPSLPAWWGLGPGMCREGSLTASFDFTQGYFDCYDYWQGGASGAITMQPVTSNRARLTVEAALPAGSPLITPLPDQVEVYAFKAVINNAKSTGLGACAGCLVQTSLCLSGFTLHAAGGDLYTGVPATRNSVTWQGQFGFFDCDVTPVQNRTWGSIKSLYR